MTASAFLANTVLRALWRLREFNADQLELRQRWLQRNGLPSLTK